MTDEMDGQGVRPPSRAGAWWRLAGPARVALGGAAGFGVGGIFVGLAGKGMLFAFALMGALGAASLSSVLGDWNRRIFLLLAGSLGFFIGFALSFFIVTGFWEPPSRALEFGFIGAIGGAVGGAAMGAVLRSWRITGWLALAGAGGFGLGLIVMGQPGLHPVPVFGIPGMVAGALMGFVAGSKRRPTEVT
ncbi:MAG: hypothetical protein ACRDJF_13395 [Actinomycetota bacterium]